ncbi:hypothetical protein [Paracoccus mutanolyticus]|nr:hypothetical protein [Paracoccus mutanolyticus]
MAETLAAWGIVHAHLEQSRHALVAKVVEMQILDLLELACAT